MPSALEAQKLGANLTVNVFDHDPGDTGAFIVVGDPGALIRVVDMREVSNFMVKAMTVVGAVTELEIVAATDAAMTTPVIIKTTGTVAADAVGDQVVLEINDQQLQGVSTADLRWAAGRITMAVGTDEAAVTYVTDLKNPHKDATANVIA